MSSGTWLGRADSISLASLVDPQARLSTALPNSWPCSPWPSSVGVVVAGMALPVLRSGRDRWPATPWSRSTICPPTFREPALPVRTRVYAADGTKIATVFEQNRKEVSIDKVAPVMAQAVVAIEDSRFYEHNGFDPRGFLRAAFTNVDLRRGRPGWLHADDAVRQERAADLRRRPTAEQAAAQEDTIARKLREIRYAMALEKRLTKDEILERYLNISYYGARAYGVEAAAQRYFSKKAAELTLVEAATLAGIVQKPSKFDPTRNPSDSQERRDVVLNRMAELGYITTEQAREAKARTSRTTWTRRSSTTAARPRSPHTSATTRSARSPSCRRSAPPVRSARPPGTRRLQDLHHSRHEGPEGCEEGRHGRDPAEGPEQKATAIAMITPGSGDIRAMTQNRVVGHGRRPEAGWETTTTMRSTWPTAAPGDAGRIHLQAVHDRRRPGAGDQPVHGDRRPAAEGLHRLRELQRWPAVREGQRGRRGRRP